MEKENRTRWNEEYWGRNQAKAIQGICAIIIIFHHMAQKTCAPWLPAEYIVHGLEPFLNLGYLMVGVFFFCSGYGLYKSVANKQDYLKGFIGRHCSPIILVFLISNAVYYMVGNVASKYNWFIYAILYLYVAFYICFRYCKKDGVSILLMTGFVALYIVICDVFVAGSWCYNNVGVFLIGLLFAKYSDKVSFFIRRNYIWILPVLAAILAVSFYYGVKINNTVGYQNDMAEYNSVRFLAIVLQLVSSAALAVFLFALGQKINFNNKVLVFIGSMSLEIYMIHVLFVEMFGFCFTYQGIGPICYIRNVFLYILVVLVLSLLSAYALSRIKMWAQEFHNKHDNVFYVIGKDIKKALAIILIAIVGTTAFLTALNAIKTPAIKQKIEEYKNGNISYVRVDNTDIALYDVGEGDRAVLILRGEYDPCPTLTQKALADDLAKEFRAVVIDFPGSGFSSEPETERTAENICREIHEVARTLGLKDYIILAEKTSCMYAQYYVHEYKGEVSAVVALDASSSNIGRAVFDNMGMSLFEYIRHVRLTAKENYLESRIVDKLGYKELIWPTISEVYSKSVGWEYEDIVKYMYFSKHENRSICKERCNEVDLYQRTEKYSYPHEMTVIDFVSQDRKTEFEQQGIDICAKLKMLSMKCKRHDIVDVTNFEYCVLLNPEIYRTNMTGLR